MANAELQQKHGWDIRWVQQTVKCFDDIDSGRFRDAVCLYQIDAGVAADGLVGADTYGVMRVREHNPTQSDIEWLARVITAEAGGRATDLEATCVGWTVVNRMLTDPEHWGAYPKAIATGKAYARRSRSADYEPSGRGLRIADYLLTERRYDPTKGATHFFSPRNMPRADSPVWPGEDEAEHRHYYRDGKDYFLWDRKHGRIKMSTKGGWVWVMNDDGRQVSVAQPGFAKSHEFCDIPGVRTWWFRFYRRKS